MSIAERILQLMEERKVTAATLTREIPLTNGLITQWKQGKQNPSIDAINKIAAYFNVSIDYLVNGKEYRGDIITNNQQSVIKSSNSSVTIQNGSKRELTKQEIDLLKIYNSLDGKKQLEMMSYVYNLGN